MIQYGLPVLYTLLIWWFSTGLILYLDGLPRRTHRWSLLGATGILIGALFGLAESRADVSVAGAYVAFTCSVAVWGWLEMSFLLGVLTGPRRTACPAGSRGWRRAIFAIEAIFHHELALLAGVGVVAGLTWNEPNQVGLWTIAILWAMRESAKLNVFLGVRNLYSEFLPEHLRYLASYFTKKPMNALFPFSITISTVLAALLWQGAFEAGGSFELAELVFLGTLVTLGVLEHWFLVLPLPVEALWSWGLKSHIARPAVDGKGLIAPRS